MSRPIPDCALQFLQKAEGCRLTAYRDGGGVLTIGWGHTGPDVVDGLVITPAQALFLLRQDAAHAVRRLELVLDDATILALAEHEWGALISFAFNLGVGPLPPKAEWTIWEDLEARRPDQVPAQMMRFDKIRLADGTLEEVPGLVHRRSAEVVLWKTADVAASAAVVAAAPVQAPPSSVTRDADTPPTPLSPKPLQTTSLGMKVGSGVAAAGACAASLQGSAQDIKGVLEPYLAQVHQLEAVAAVLTGVIVACTIAQILINRFQASAAAR